MTNKLNSTLYVGVTSNLIKRVYEHREKLFEGFTKKYSIVKLVYFEHFEDIGLAIKREKKIKAGSRKKKNELVELNNPDWKDLYDELLR